MTQAVINLGTAPTGAGGDTERAAFDKCNANFTELYAGGGIESASNAKGSYTKFPNGTLITWGVQTVNANTPAGQGVVWDAGTANQPYPFTDLPIAKVEFAFMTGANGSGDTIYSSVQTYNGTNNRPLTVGINMGTRPALAHPSFVYGTQASASYLVYFQCVGRWK